MCISASIVTSESAAIVRTNSKHLATLAAVTVRCTGGNLSPNQPQRTHRWHHIPTHFASSRVRHRCCHPSRFAC